MWSQAKLIFAGISSLVVGIFLYLFKARGEKIEEQKEEIKELEREAHLAELLKDVTEDLEKEYKDKKGEIDLDYEEGLEKAYSDPTVDLSPSLLSKLRDVQGLSDNFDRDSQ